MLKKLMWLLSLTALLSFTSCGGGSDEAKELLQRLLRLVGVPHNIVVNICQDNNKNGFCESIEPHVSIVINQGDTAQTLWQKITETSDGQYLLETYDPTKPILLELQDVAKVNFDEGKFTLNFDGYENREQNNTKELSILQSMVDANAISVVEADKFRTLINQEAQDKFYITLLNDLETNINTLRADGLDKQTAMSATIKEMGDETKTNQEQADRINDCDNNQTCVDKEIKKISDEFIITEEEATEIKAKEQLNSTIPEATPTPLSGAEVQNGKWVKPSQSVCENNGGSYNNNICSANLENSNNICYSIGGVLPIIEELRTVIIDCGGVVNSDYSDNNIKNDYYQSCYQERGFSSGFYYYWSSSAFNTSNTWVVYFYEGKNYEVANDYNRDVDVRCVREEQ